MDKLPDQCIMPFDLSIQLGLISFNCDFQDALVRRTAIQGNKKEHTRGQPDDQSEPCWGFNETWISTIRSSIVLWSTFVNITS